MCTQKRVDLISRNKGTAQSELGRQQQRKNNECCDKILGCGQADCGDGTGETAMNGRLDNENRVLGKETKGRTDTMAIYGRMRATEIRTTY
jgi:hypothetical protein